MTTSDVALVCMPWAMATRPSIALGILKSLLDEVGIRCAVHSYQLAFADHIARRTRQQPRPIGLAGYEEIAERLTPCGAGDWCFNVPPYRMPNDEQDREYLARLLHLSSAEAVELVTRVRELVPEFLDDCVREIVAAAPRVVGFTSTFCQNVPSLVLARMIKQRLPHVTIVFGGSNCDGVMGAALHRNFPWVDIVVRGEGEHVLPALVAEILASLPLTERPGLCFRRDGELVHVPETSDTVPLDEVPRPNYDEYFERLGEAALEPDVRALMAIPFEAARGCWWGAKHHCTFCGLNGQTMRFRSKTPQKVYDEIRTLASKYQCLSFFAVDNIIDTAYFTTLLPWLKDSGWSLSVFFETKANLKRSDVKALADAGVRHIQPGIESLSSSVLAIMRKGVTALINIRLLKLCAEYQVLPRWNLLQAFPGETAEAYVEMAEIVPSLTHLYPPGSIGSLRIDRFSPYFVDGEQLGIRVTGPKWFYRYLYDVDDAELFDLAYFFDGQAALTETIRSAHAKLREAVDRWSAAHDRAYRQLTYQVGPDFVILLDYRPGLGPARYVLDRVEARIYLACDTGTTPGALVRALGSAAEGMTVEEVRVFLDEMVAARVMFREGDRYLSLAIAENPAAIARAEPDGVEEPSPMARAQPLISLRRARPVAAAGHDVAD